MKNGENGGRSKGDRLRSRGAGRRWQAARAQCRRCSRQSAPGRGTSILADSLQCHAGKIPAHSETHLRVEASDVVQGKEKEWCTCTRSGFKDPQVAAGSKAACTNHRCSSSKTRLVVAHVGQMADKSDRCRW
jgi:hypothetical protein